MYDIRKINIWKTEESRQEKQAYLGAPIEELNLAARAFNGLKRAGCHTVGDLVGIIESEGEGLKGIRNLGAKSEREILTQLEWFRGECAKGHAAGYGSSSRGESGGEEHPSFARRSEVRGRRNVWEADIEDFHLSDYALGRLRACRVRKVKDLYATNPKNEPGWYAVRELLEKI
ncbi:MAG: hypothetical protein IJJ38_02000 [Lachnospiraceae bacterium]|nr:hypothetical protein [Lachnospiraceae bacterium]